MRRTTQSGQWPWCDTCRCAIRPTAEKAGRGWWRRPVGRQHDRAAPPCRPWMHGVCSSVAALQPIVWRTRPTRRRPRRPWWETSRFGTSSLRTGLEPREVPNSDGTIIAPSGTTVQIKAKTATPFQAVAIQVGELELIDARLVEGRELTASITVERSGSWKILPSRTRRSRRASRTNFGWRLTRRQWSCPRAGSRLRQ